MALDDEGRCCWWKLLLIEAGAAECFEIRKSVIWGHPPPIGGRQLTKCGGSALHRIPPTPPLRPLPGEAVLQLLLMSSSKIEYYFLKNLRFLRYSQLFGKAKGPWSDRKSLKRRLYRPFRRARAIPGTAKAILGTAKAIPWTAKAYSHFFSKWSLITKKNDTGGGPEIYSS